MVNEFLTARTWAHIAAQITTIAALIAAVASMAPAAPTTADAAPATEVVAEAAAAPALVDVVSNAAPALNAATQQAQRALAAQPFQPSAIGFTISFEAPRAGHLGLTFPDRNHIEIYVRPNMSDAALISVVAHELGHAFDLATSTVESRNDFRATRGWSLDTGWFTGPSQNDLSTPSGDYAECFATWAVGASSQSAKGTCDAGATQLIASHVANAFG